MKRLIVLELDKALHGGWFLAALGIGCAVACVSAALEIAGVWDWQALKAGGADEWIIQSIQGSYGNSLFIGGDLAREVFFLLAPLLAVVPYVWSWRSESVDGMLAQMYVRSSRGGYLAAKGLATFVAGFLVTAAPIALNFVVLSCSLPAYAPEALDQLYIGIYSQEAFSGLLYGAPLAYIAVNVVVDGALCGSWAVLVLAISTLVDNRVVLLAGSYVLVLVMRYLNQVIFAAAGITGVRFNLIDLLQGEAATYVRSEAVLWLVLVGMLLAGVVVLRARRDGDVL